MFINWWKMRSASENVNEGTEGSDSDKLGGETRLTSAAGTQGFIEGRTVMPLGGGKWNLQFYAFWPDYSKKDGVSDHSTGTFPLQAYGKQIEDTITATMNGQVVEMGQPKVPGGAYFLVDFVENELVWRFDFTSKTPEQLARPFIVSGEVTMLRDDSTGDEGAGVATGKGALKGTVMNAIDGKKVAQVKKTSNDGKQYDLLFIFAFVEFRLCVIFGNLYSNFWELMLFWELIKTYSACQVGTRRVSLSIQTQEYSSFRRAS